MAYIHNPNDPRECSDEEKPKDFIEYHCERCGNGDF
jgi:hypothetical protein